MTPGDGEVFILTTLVNGCELNFGVFRSIWISEILTVCFRLSFGRNLLLWLLLAYERLCVWVPCLRYPWKGKIPRGYYYYISLTLYAVEYGILVDSSIQLHEFILNSSCKYFFNTSIRTSINIFVYAFSALLNDILLFDFLFSTE